MLETLKGQKFHFASAQVLGVGEVVLPLTSTVTYDRVMEEYTGLGCTVGLAEGFMEVSVGAGRYARSLYTYYVKDPRH
ncbi:hypothetical protein ADL22_12575 [Streptomyces sp. NRRL F-4489]|nr:hypothetical protein ADL22_12575 [Streptomyces sp. NRRL F-4489]